MKQYSFLISTEDDLEEKLFDLSKEEQVQKAKDLLFLINVGSCDSIIASSCISRIKERFPKAKIAGLSTAGELTDGQLTFQSISVTLLTFQKSKVEVIPYDLTDEDPYDVGSHISSHLNSIRDLKHVHILLTGTTIVDKLFKFLRSIYLNSPSVQVSGASAANQWPKDQEDTSVNTFVFSDQILHRGAIIINFIGKGLSVQTSMNLGWIPVGKEHVITDVSNDIKVSTIDGEPAANLYRKYLGISTPHKLVKNTQEFPLIVKRGNDQPLARNIIAALPDGSLEYACELNPGDHVRLSFGSLETILRDAENDSFNIAAFHPEGLLLVICAMRNQYLGEDEMLEINNYKNVFPTVSGCVGFGEFFRCGFRVEELSYTLVSIAFKENDNSDLVDDYRFEIPAPEEDDEPDRLLLYPEETMPGKKPSRNVIPINGTGDIIPLSDRMFTFLRETTREYALIKEQERERNLINKIEIEKKGNEAKSAFLSHMSHELRTPINAILGMNEMIIRESHNANILQYAEDIKKAGDSLLSIINDVLDYSKIEAGKIPIKDEEYSLSAMINEVSIMTRAQAESKSLKVKVNADKNIPDLLYGDMPHIRQCLINLLSNAVKYTEKGHIRFTVSSNACDDPDKIELTFHVRDTGIGIKKEDLDLLFEPFERIEERKNRSVEGSGLGLNITNMLVELMGGKLGVDSVYHKGSDFYFNVMQTIVNSEPIGNLNERLKKLSKKKSTSKEAFHAPDAKVLVVDDNAMNLTVVKKLLQRTKVNVDTAKSGPEAIELARKEKYDIIFMDHLMPDMDGVETMKRIRFNEAGPNKETPMIILTANTVAGMKEMFLQEGFDDYLEKPTKPALLETIVGKYINSDMIRDEAPEEAKSGTDESSEEKEQAKVPDNALFNAIKDVCSEIKIAAGIESCGSPETYSDVLKQYVDNGNDNLSIIEQAVSEGDYQTYRIKIHSLKSSSALAGATALSKKAAKLEEAVTNGETEYIIQETPAFLNKYKKILRQLSVAFDSVAAKEVRDDSREPISPENFESALTALKEFVSVFDFESADYVIKDLSRYRLDDKKEALFEKLKALVKNVDHDKIIPLLEGRK